jgi:hypothetical protein
VANIWTDPRAVLDQIKAAATAGANQQTLQNILDNSMPPSGFAVIGQAVDAIGKGLSDAANAVGNAVTKTVDFISNNIGTAIAVGATLLGVPPTATLAAESALGLKVLPGATQITQQIQGAVNSVAGGTGDVINNVLGAIGDDINKLIKGLPDIINGVEKDVLGSLQSVLGPINDITNTLAGVPASLNNLAATQYLGSKKIADEVFVPAMSQHINEPLTKIGGSVDRIAPVQPEHLTEQKQVTLSKDAGLEDAEKQLQKFRDYLFNGTGLAHDILYGLYSLLMAGAADLASIEQFVEAAKQQSKQLFPINILDVQTAIEAQSRGILSEDDARQEVLANGINQDRLKILRELHTKILDPNTLTEALKRGIINADDFATEMLLQDYSPDRIDIIKQLSGYVPQMTDALSWFARGLIDDATLTTFATSNGVNASELKLLKDASNSPIVPASMLNVYDRIAARDKGFMPTSFTQVAPPAVKDAYKKAGADPEQPDIDWLSHWKDLGSGDWLSAFYRGFINIDQLHLALTAQGLPIEAVDILLQLSRPQLPIREVLTLIETGNLSTQQASDYLARQGFDADTIDLMLKYAEVRIYGHVAETTNSMVQLSIEQLATMFADGVIDAEQYKQGLIAHKYTEEAAKLLVELKEVELELKNRKEVAAEIVAEYKLGNIDLTTAQSELHSAGFSQGEVNKYTLQMSRIKPTNPKLPSEADLFKMYKKQLIGRDLVISTLIRSGYSKLWAYLIFMNTTGEQVNDITVSTLIGEATGINQGVAVPTQETAPGIAKEFGQSRNASEEG